MLWIKFTVLHFSSSAEVTAWLLVKIAADEGARGAVGAAQSPEVTALNVFIPDPSWVDYPATERLHQSHWLGLVPASQWNEWNIYRTAPAQRGQNMKESFVFVVFSFSGIGQTRPQKVIDLSSVSREELQRKDRRLDRRRRRQGTDLRRMVDVIKGRLRTERPSDNSRLKEWGQFITTTLETDVMKEKINTSLSPAVHMRQSFLLFL